MMQGRVQLTAEKILEKEFKTGMRGYNQDDVDRFLDIVIKDYEMFKKIISQLEQENEKLKRTTESPIKRQETQPLTGTTNFDILQRLSNLEKHVFGSKLFD